MRAYLKCKGAKAFKTSRGGGSIDVGTNLNIDIDCHSNNKAPKPTIAMIVDVFLSNSPRSSNKSDIFIKETFT
jgi:hypothetical protein